MAHDSRADIKTFAMMIGPKASSWFYAFEMVFPYVWVGVLSLLGILPVYTIIIFLTIPIAIGCAGTLVKAPQDITIIADLDVRTANLQLLFSLLLSISFVLAYFL